MPRGSLDWPRQGPEEWQAQANETRTPFGGVSGIDGEERLFFWNDAPLYSSRIIVGISYKAMVTRWIQAITPIVVFGLVIGLASMAILMMLYRSRTRNLAYASQLEGDVRERTRELNRAVEQKDRILQELGHRVRNAFATILALTRQMLRSSETLEDFRREFPARLEALSAHTTPARRSGGARSGTDFGYGPCSACAISSRLSKDHDFRPINRVDVRGDSWGGAHPA